MGRRASPLRVQAVRPYREASSARVALLLGRRGIKRVRPLADGFHGWRERGYPLIGEHASPTHAGGPP